MNLILAKDFFANKKVKKEFLNRLKADKTIPNGLKNSLSISPFQKEFITYIVVEENEVLGFITAEILEEEFIYEGDVAMVSYYIFPEKRRKGYMTSAIKIFTRILFEDEKINIMLFGIDSSNNASIEFAKSIGAIQMDDYSFEYNISD